MYYIAIINNNGNLATFFPFSNVKKRVWCESDDVFGHQFFVSTNKESVVGLGDIWECEVDEIQRYYGYPKLGYEEEFLKAKKNHKNSNPYWISIPEEVKCVKRIRLIRKVYPEPTLLEKIVDWFT